MAFNPNLFNQLIRAKHRTQALGILFKVIAIIAAVAVAGVGGYTVYKNIVENATCEHQFSTEWSSDETNHWHAAICDKNDECASATADVAAHTFDKGACSVCGYEDPNYVPPTPECKEHAWGAANVTKEPTCTEAGEQVYTCLLCGATDTDEIAPLGHTEEKIDGIAATCTTPGMSAGKKCSVCDTILTAQNEIPATGHSFVEGTCSACGEIDPDYNGSKTYVLDVQTLTAFAAGSKADGDTEIVADFFTIYYSAKTKIDTTKDKTWPDGYTVAEGLRLNWGGTTAIGETTKNAIEINVDGTATVKVWWVCGGDGREIGIFDENGELVVSSETDDVFAESEGVGAGKNGVYLCELTLDNAGKYYIGTDNTNATKNGGNIIFKVEVVVSPAEEEAAKEIKVETTDTYTTYDLDFFTFAATAEGYYTFKIPAGLGVLRDGARVPEIDYYDNANGYEFTIGIKADQEVKFWVSATTKDLWTIEWSFEEGEVKEDEPDTPIEGDATELVVGPNTVVFGDGELSEGKIYPFVVTEEGTYTFNSDLMAIVMDAEGNMVGRGQVYLVPGSYSVALTSMMPLMGNSFNVNITFAPNASGEPDGSSDYPFVLDTLPESITFESDTFTYVFYVFTATVNGSVKFTWATEDSYFVYFELDENGNTTENTASGYMNLSHIIAVEAGKSYKVGLCTWMEPGETTVTVSEVACDHSWSEATCSAPATCATCGATTGDKADHTSSGEATCSQPEVCTVCGEELSTAWHEMEETYVYATCTEAGSYHGVCTVCGYEESSVIPANGHYNVDLSCGETGTCTECGVEFTLEHDFTWGAATCTDPAYCYVCEQYVGEALGHNFVGGVCTECYLTHTLVVAGTASLVGSDWVLEDENNILSYDYENSVFTITYENVAAGTHEFKVIDVTNGYNWDHQYPTNNYKIIVEEGSKVIISVDLVTGTMTCQVYALNSDVATDGGIYMVVGDAGLCGDIDAANGDWGWEFENLDNCLTLNAEGKYEIVYNGVAAGSYGIKVVRNFTWDEQWGDNGGNYIITVDADNSIVTILFDPATGTISYTAHAHSWSDATCKDPQKCECGATQGNVGDHVDGNGDFKCDTCSTTVLPEDGTALTIPQALAIAKLAGASYTTQKYYITGIISSVANTTYGNIYIVDAEGNELYLYGLYTWNKAVRYDAMETKPVKGDEITVYTVLGTYNGAAQGKDTWLDELVQHTEHVWEDATCVAPKTCKLCDATEGDKAAHNFVNGTCSVCQAVQGVEYATATMAYTTNSTTNMTGSNDAAKLGLDATIFSVIGNKGGTNNNCGLNKAGQIRLYGSSANGNGSYFTVTAAEGYTIKSIKITFTNTTNNKNCQLTVDGTSEIFDGSSNTWECDINSNSFKLQNVIKGATTQIYISSIEITYEVPAN